VNTKKTLKNPYVRVKPSKSVQKLKVAKMQKVQKKHFVEKLRINPIKTRSKRVFLVI
jgi:hypothetical protein